MRKKMCFMICLSAFLYSAIPQSVQADTIGISPPKVDVKVFTQNIRQEKISISRDTTEGEMTFRIVNDGMSLVTIAEGATMTIPEGANTQDFFFTIDAAHAEVGRYDGIFSFIVSPPEGEAFLVNGTAVEFVLKTGIHVEVIDRPDVNTTLSLFDFPALITDAGVDDVRVTQTSGIDGRAITMTWNATNSGLNPLDGAFARVRVMQKENIFFDDQSIAIPTMSAGGISEQSVSFVLSNSYPSGRYTVHVGVGNTEQIASFWIIKPLMQWNLGLLGVSTLSAGTAFAVHRRRRRQRK